MKCKINILICFFVLVFVFIFIYNIIKNDFYDQTQEDIYYDNFACLQIKEEMANELKEENFNIYNAPLDIDLQYFIFNLCEEYKIEPDIIISMIEQESSFRSDIIGDNGNSFGLMQIQPKWHKDRMEKLGVENLLDPYQNVLVGINYFSELLHKGNGVKWALAAYNAGPTGANKGYGFDYAEEVLNRIGE